MNLEDRKKGEVGRELTNMLNWAEWMGLMLRNDWIDRDLLFGSTSSVFSEIIMECPYRIERDMEDPDKGPNWWSNVLYIAE